MNAGELNIIDNEDQLCFEAATNNGVAFISYRWENGKLAFMHTEVPNEDEGEGVGTQLATFAFEQAKKQQRKVLVYCPFISAYLKKHPEYKELIQKDYNA